MSLVVAYIQNGRAYIVSDTKATNDGDTLLSLTKGVLKTVILNPSLCVSYSGDVRRALGALREIHKAGAIDHSIDEVCERLEPGTRSGTVDFLVATKDSLRTVKSGRSEANDLVAWIGEQPAFNSYQEYFHRTAVSPSYSAVKNEDLATRSRMNDAFGLVLADSRFPSVKGFLISTAHQASEPSGFNYSPRAEGFDFQPAQATGKEESLTRPRNASEGGYNFTLLVPRRPGIGVIGIHFLQGRLGALYHPLISDVPILYRSMNIAQFVAAVHLQCGIELSGMSWGHDGVRV